MKKISLIFCSVLLGMGMMAAQGITGKWSGILDAEGGKIALVFNISETKKGGYTATMDSPGQGAMGIPTTSTTFENNILKVTIDQIKMVYEGTLDGEMIKGTFTQMGYSFPLDLKRGGYEIKRPQEPKKPYPYNAKDITFVNEAAGITLAGTITYPKKAKGLPAVVLVSGSGPQDRNEEIFGHKPFMVLADHLTRAGIVVLRFDDRGTGMSQGDYASASMQDHAADAKAALECLKSRPEVDATKVGIIGHSMGSSVAIMLGAEGNDIGYIISLAGPGVKGDKLMVEQRRALMTAAGMSEEQFLENEGIVEKIQAIVDTHGAAMVYAKPENYVDEVIPASLKWNKQAREMFKDEIKRGAAPELQSLLKYDPAADLAKLTVPVLALNGALDLQVPADLNLEGFQASVKSELTTKKYPGLNHLFQHAETGMVNEYGTIEETISPEVLADITNWILKTTN